MQNLFRKLLNPDNKDVFNKLLGVEHSGAYDIWWNKNIKPLQNSIKKLYKPEEYLMAKSGYINGYDKHFRKSFDYNIIGEFKLFHICILKFWSEILQKSAFSNSAKIVTNTRCKLCYVTETYNSCVLLAYFCNAHPEIEEIGNITPLVNLVRQKLDLLYAGLIDMEEDANSK